MRIEQCLYLIKIAEIGSFSNTAKVFHTSQPSVSQAIKMLEAELGVTLFERGNFGTTLTTVGQEILPHAKALCKEAEIIAQISENALKNNSSIRVVAGPMPITTFLPKLIGQSNTRYSSDIISVTEANTCTAEQLITAEKADLAIVPYIVPPSSVLFTYTPILKGRLFAMVHTKSPLAERNILSYADIQPYPVAIGSDENITSPYIIEKLQQYGPTNIALRVRSSSTAATYVKNSIAVGIIFDLSLPSNINNISPDIRIISLDDPLVLTFGILTKRGKPLHSTAKQFISQLRKEATLFQKNLQSLCHEQHLI